MSENSNVSLAAMPRNSSSLFIEGVDIDGNAVNLSVKSPKRRDSILSPFDSPKKSKLVEHKIPVKEMLRFKSPNEITLYEIADDNDLKVVVDKKKSLYKARKQKAIDPFNIRVEKITDLQFSYNFELFNDFSRIPEFTKLRYIDLSPQKNFSEQQLQSYLNIFEHKDGHNLVPRCLAECKQLKQIVCTGCNCDRDVEGQIFLIKSLPKLIQFNVNALATDKDKKCWRKVLYAIKGKLLAFNDKLRVLDVRLCRKYIVEAISDCSNAIIDEKSTEAEKAAEACKAEKIEIPDWLDVKFALHPENMSELNTVTEMDMSGLALDNVNLSNFVGHDLRSQLIKLNLENNELVQPFSESELKNPDEDISWMFPNLRVLNLRKNKILSSDAAIPFVAPCVNLKHVLIEEQQYMKESINEYRVGLIAGILDIFQNYIKRECIDGNNLNINKFLDIFQLRIIDNKWIMPSEFFFAFNKVAYTSELVFDPSIFKLKLAGSRASNEEVLDLSCAELDFDDDKNFDAIFDLSDSLRKVNLSHNQLTADSLMQIRTQYLLYVDDVDLSDNKIGDNEVELLNLFLDQCPNLESVNIADNPVNSGNGKFFVDRCRLPSIKNVNGRSRYNSFKI